MARLMVSLAENRWPQTGRHLEQTMARHNDLRDLARVMASAPLPTSTEPVEQVQEPVIMEQEEPVTVQQDGPRGLPWKIVGYHLITDAKPYEVRPKSKTDNPGVGRTVGEIEVELFTVSIIRCKVALVKHQGLPPVFDVTLPSKSNGTYATPIFTFKTQDAKDCASLWRRYAAEQFDTWRQSVPGLKLRIIKPGTPDPKAQVTTVEATGIEE